MQRYVPNVTVARACLPLEPPLPLGVLWAQIGGGVLWPSLLPNLALGQHPKVLDAEFVGVFSGALRNRGNYEYRQL